MNATSFQAFSSALLCSPNFHPQILLDEGSSHSAQTGASVPCLAGRHTSSSRRGHGDGSADGRGGSRIHSHAALEAAAWILFHLLKNILAVNRIRGRRCPHPCRRQALVLTSRSLSLELPGRLQPAAGLEGILAGLTRKSAEPNKLGPDPLPLVFPAAVIWPPAPACSPRVHAATSS